MDFSDGFRNHLPTTNVWSIFRGLTANHTFFAFGRSLELQWISLSCVPKPVSSFILLGVMSIIFWWTTLFVYLILILPRLQSWPTTVIYIQHAVAFWLKTFLNPPWTSLAITINIVFSFFLCATQSSCHCSERISFQQPSWPRHLIDTKSSYCYDKYRNNPIPVILKLNRHTLCEFHKSQA